MTTYIPKHILSIKVHDMHTAGEPVRIILSGIPAPSGNTVLQKIQDLRKNYDNYRQLLMNEPRGHKDMYGAILMVSEFGRNTFDVIFLHNEGYSSMCGHAVIALGRYIIDFGLIKGKSPETPLTFNCPCGPVKCFVKYDKEVTSVRFQSVPAFVFQKDVTISVPGIGNVTVDIVYGGAFYAIVDDQQLDLSVEDSAVSELVKAAWSITNAVKKEIKIKHPVDEDLSALYGTIITDGKDTFEDGASKNICVFADQQVDRSPTGSGVTARIALQFMKGQMSLNQEKEFKSIINTSFTGKAISQTKFHDYDAVIVEVAGMAYHTGNHTFYLEEKDPLSNGFQLSR